MEKITYAKVTPEIVLELQHICGERNVVFRDAENLEKYSHDEIPGTHYRTMPECAVRPRTAEEIAAIVKLANREKIPLTPRGAGSGLSGGAVPVFGGIVIATDRMNSILEVDPENMMMTLEPGVVSNEINEHLKGTGLFYAGYPMSLETCFIGGNVAENAGGGKTIKYGVTGRYVVGLEVVTPDGDIVQLGGKLLKDVTGYNLISLFTGSEGTLGIFTKIILKLIPKPKLQVDLLCLFKTGDDAIRAVPELMTRSGIIPTSCEYMDKLSVTTSCAGLNESLPCGDCGAMLLLTLDGNDPEHLFAQYTSVGSFAKKCGAIEVYVADNKAASERLWKIRRGIPESFSLLSPFQCGEDIVVPPSKIAEVVAEFESIAAKYGVLIPCYGHAGDGNVHARISAPGDMTESHFDEILPQMLRELYTVVAAFGGRISGEHGIGCKRKPFMRTVVSEEYLNLLRKIKHALDPNCIMNPGKIFDL